MRMLSFLPPHDWKGRVEKVFSTAQSIRETVSLATRCARYAGVMVDPDLLTFRNTLHLIRQLRQENADTSWFTVARYPAARNGVLQLSQIGVGFSP
jgi:hypothetical protein